MSDEDEIRQLIAEHFEAMRWSEATEPDWGRFRQDFLADALLCDAARPVQFRLLNGFIELMETVTRRNLTSFEEHTRGTKILHFGNIALVLAMSELLENGSGTSHDISGYLIVKSDGRWSIMAHACEPACKKGSSLFGVPRSGTP